MTTGFRATDYPCIIFVADHDGRLRFAATRLLGSLVRIPLKVRMFASCCLCVLTVAAAATG